MSYAVYTVHKEMRSVGFFVWPQNQGQRASQFGSKTGSCGLMILSYPVFIIKPSTHHMHNPGSIVSHIRPKVFTDNQMSRIKYNCYYINSVSKDYDDSQWNGTVEDSITP
jgi:hypothetical protein